MQIRLYVDEDAMDSDLVRALRLGQRKRSELERDVVV